MNSSSTHVSVNNYIYIQSSISHTYVWYQQDGKTLAVSLYNSGYGQHMISLL